MANEIQLERTLGHLGNAGKTRVMDYLGDESVFAVMRASILYDTDEIELGTLTNPICITGGGSGIVSTAPDVLEISQTPTITIGAYTAGDALGGLLTFPNAAVSVGGKGMVTKVVVTDSALQSAPVDLVLFNQAFTSNNDNDPFAVTDADLLNCLGHIPVANTDYSEFANNCEATKSSGQQMPFEYDLAGTSLFGQLKIGVGDTFGAVDNITVKITVRRYG